MKKMKPRHINSLLLLSIISAFLITPLYTALWRGVCCFDDASFAARYLYVCNIIWCFYVTSPILMNKNLVQGFLPSLICLLLLTPLAGKHLLHNISAVFGEEARNQVRSPNSAELKVLEYIEAANSGEKIYTPWWAYVAQLEYLSSRPAMFTGWDLMEKYSPGQ